MNNDLQGHELTVEIMRHLMSRAEDRHPGVRIVILGVSWTESHQFMMWYNVGQGTHMSTWKEPQ